MRLLLATLLTGLLAGAVLVLAPGPAAACSCANRDLAAHVEAADSIGVGRVAWIATNTGTTIFAVDFTEVHKGRLGSREKVRTASNEASCGLEVRDGHRYLLFVRGEHGGRVHTGLCSGSAGYDAQADAQVQTLAGGGELVRVDQSDITPRKEWVPPWVQWTLVGTAAFVLVTTAALAMRYG